MISRRRRPEPVTIKVLARQFRHSFRQFDRLDDREAAAHVERPADVDRDVAGGAFARFDLGQAPTRLADRE